MLSELSLQANGRNHRNLNQEQQQWKLDHVPRGFVCMQIMLIFEYVYI